MTIILAINKIKTGVYLIIPIIYNKNQVKIHIDITKSYRNIILYN